MPNMDSPAPEMMKSSILVRYDCYNNITQKSTPISIQPCKSRVPMGVESPRSKVKAWLTKYNTNLACKNPVEYPEETLLKVEERFAKESILQRKDCKEDNYDVQPMSPESQKKNELCSYLKLMNMKVKKNKNGMVLQNRRSTRVKNLMILTEKKELERKLSIEAKEKEESEISVKFKPDEEFDICFNGGFSVKHVPESLLKKEEDFESSMNIIVRDVRKVRNKENLKIKLKNKENPKMKNKSKENLKLKITNKENIRKVKIRNGEDIQDKVINKENKPNVKNNTKKTRKNKVKNKENKKVRIWGTRTSPRGSGRILRQKVKDKFKYLVTKNKVKLNVKKKKRKADNKKKSDVKIDIEHKDEKPKVELKTITLIEHNYTLDPSYKALNQEITNNSNDKEIIKKLTPEHRKALLESSKIANKVKIMDCMKSINVNGTIHSKDNLKSSPRSLRSNSLPENKQENCVNNNFESDFKIVLLNGTKKEENVKKNEIKEENKLIVDTKVEEVKDHVIIDCEEKDKRRNEHFEVKVIIGISPKKIVPSPNVKNVIEEPKTICLPRKLNSVDKNVDAPEEPKQSCILKKTNAVSKNKIVEEQTPICSPIKINPVKEVLEDIKPPKPINSSKNMHPIITNAEIEQTPISSSNNINIIPVSKISQKSLHRNLSNKRKHPSHHIKSPQMSSAEINTWDNRKSPHAINLSHEHGSILNSSYFDYNLIITQDLRVSFWTQSALGLILEAQNMWIPKGGLQRLALDNGCVLRVCKESVISKEGSFGYVELYTKEHTSDRRERPVTDIFTVIYFWRERQREPEKKLLQLANINGSAEDVRHVVLKNCGNILVSWKIFKDDNVISVIHSYQLASDYQTIVSIKELESVDHTIYTLHNIEDCDTLVMGCGDHKITIWNLEFGYIVATIDITDSLNLEPTTLWVKCDRGFLFTLQQCSDGTLRLLAINGINHSWKRLQMYKAPTGFYKLEGVCIENGILICFYANGVLCYKVQSGDLVMEELSSDTKYLPSGKHVITYTSDNQEVNVRNALSYLITNYDFTDT